MGWRTIDSAPRDGTWVLLRGGEPDELPDQPYPCVAAWWSAEFEAWTFGWFDSNWRQSYNSPTEWMPIPA